MSAATQALPRLLRGLLLPLALACAWELLSRRNASFGYAFVPLGTLWSTFVELLGSGEIWIYIGASLKTALGALLIGSTAGFMLGSLMAGSRWVELTVSPLYNAMRQVPTMGFIPLIALWFGSTEGAKLLLVSIATFEVMVLNTYEGLRHVESRLKEVGMVLTFSRSQMFTRVLLPAAMPSIFTGLFQAVAFAWIATVGAELLFTVGPGLGVVMERAQQADRMDVVIICMALIGIMGFAMNALCRSAGRRVLRHRTV